MNKGIGGDLWPDTKHNYVELNSEEEKALRKKAFVLWTGSDMEGRTYVDTCVEVPINETCGQCYFKNMCEFSKAERKG